MISKNLLKVSDLSRTVKPKLSRMSFTVTEGEVLALVGPNGVGKTSLLKCLLGILDCNGKIEVEGIEISTISRKELAKKIAYVPQIPENECQLKVEQYLDLSFFASSRISLDRKNDAIRLLKLEKLLIESFDTLSGGERQRVLIACAFCQNPKIYLLDEPFAALDIANTKEVMEIIKLLKTSGSAVLIALHDLNLVSFCADRVLQVVSGELLATEHYVNAFSDNSYPQAL